MLEREPEHFPFFPMDPLDRAFDQYSILVERYSFWRYPQNIAREDSRNFALAMRDEARYERLTLPVGEEHMIDGIEGRMKTWEIAIDAANRDNWIPMGNALVETSDEVRRLSASDTPEQAEADEIIAQALINMALSLENKVLLFK